MPNFECDLSDSRVIDPLMIGDIVSSKDFANIQGETKHRLFNEPEVQKWFVPVDCSYWNIDIITVVAPLTIIPEHKHDEPVMRYLLQGSLELNGVEYVEGDWVIVPANKLYGIQTKTGYKILSRYHEECAECNWATLAKMPTSQLSP